MSEALSQLEICPISENICKNLRTKFDIEEDIELINDYTKHSAFNLEQTGLMSNHKLKICYFVKSKTYSDWTLSSYCTWLKYRFCKENSQLLSSDNTFEAKATKLLVNQQNHHLTNEIHDQGDTHQCWAYALATMLQHSRTGLNFQLNWKFSLRRPY